MRGPFTLLRGPDGRPVVLRFGLVLSGRRSPEDQRAAAPPLPVTGRHLATWKRLADRPAPDALDEAADELAQREADRLAWFRLAR
jgi:hypothetical protein